MPARSRPLSASRSLIPNWIVCDRISPGANRAWQTVPVGPKDVRSNNAEHTGEVTWYPQNASGTMEIRLRVNDLAGNPAESHTQSSCRGSRKPGNGKSRATTAGTVAAIPVGTNPLARGRRSRLPRRTGPQLHLLRYNDAFARSAARPADPWQPLGPRRADALAGGKRQSGFHRSAKTASVAE